MVAQSHRNTAISGFGPKRYLALDGWRGICAVLVAMLHFGNTGFISTSALVDKSHLFVDFFFVLSGFVLAHAYLDRLTSALDFRRMVWRRLGRLWPLHLAVLAGFVALEASIPVLSLLTGIERTAAATFSSDGAAPLGQLPGQIFFLQGLGLFERSAWNVPSWSISVEFWTTVLFGLLVLVLWHRPRALAWVAGGLIICGISVMMLASPSYMAVETGLAFWRCIASFFAGVLVFRVSRSWPAQVSAPTVVEIVCVALVVIFVILGGNTPAEFAAPLVFSFVVWLFAEERGAVSRLLQSRPLQTLGLWSYSIYLVHSLIIAVVHRTLTLAERTTGSELVSEVTTATGSSQLISFGGPLLMDAMTIVYVAIVLAASALTWRWIEMPAQRYWNGRLWSTLQARLSHGATVPDAAAPNARPAQN